MFKIFQTLKGYLADIFPLQAASFSRYLDSGPNFKLVGDLWLLEDHTGSIHIPSIRRYRMYLPDIGSRIRYMNSRYMLGDLADALVIDVGAHLGEFAIAAAPVARKIICFEPDPVVRQALIANVAQFSNVHVMPVALSNENKISKFFMSTALADSSLFEPDRYQDIIEVGACRLDSLGIDVGGFRRVVLKMDAEGFEPEVLLGGGEWLRNLDALSVDVSPERGGKSTYFECKQILESVGLMQIDFSPSEVLLTERRK